MAKYTGLLCAFILIIAETAQSFVLLTANVKDIKKIARNFVSDALADKIAEFVVKATEQISDQNEDSGKNKVNTDMSRSREYESTDIGRQREEKPRNSDNYKDKYINDRKPQGFKKDSFIKNNYKKDKDSLDNKNSFFKKDSFTKDRFKQDDNEEKNNYKVDFDINEVKQSSRDWSKENKDVSGDRFDHEQKKWHKEVIEIDSNERQDNIFSNKNRLGSFKSEENTRGPSRFSTTEREYWKKKNDARAKNKVSSEESKFKFDDNDDGDRQRPEKESNVFQYYNKRSSSRPKSKTNMDKSRNDEGAFQNREKEYSKTEGTFPRYESKAFKNRQHGRSDERLERYSRPIKRDRFKTVVNSAESRDTKYVNRVKETKIYRSADVTTKKEKTDFDQYDNRNYPKAQFIATSGNLMLPRVNEKEENKENDGVETKEAWWEKEMPNPVKIISWPAAL